MKHTRGAGQLQDASETAQDAHRITRQVTRRVRYQESRACARHERRTKERNTFSRVRESASRLECLQKSCRPLPPLSPEGGTARSLRERDAYIVLFVVFRGIGGNSSASVRAPVRARRPAFDEERQSSSQARSTLSNIAFAIIQEKLVLVAVILARRPRVHLFASRRRQVALSFRSHHLRRRTGSSRTPSLALSLSIDRSIVRVKPLSSLSSFPRNAISRETPSA